MYIRYIHVDHRGCPEFSDTPGPRVAPKHCCVFPFSDLGDWLWPCSLSARDTTYISGHFYACGYGSMTDLYWEIALTVDLLEI